MNFIIDLFFNLLSFIWGVARIIIPLMIVMEILKDLKIIDKISSIIKPIANFFTINEKSGISLDVGILFGLLYGAGTILKNAEEYNLDKRSIFLVCMFLSLCHAVIEDTFIFSTIGAYNYAAILGSRVIAAILTTFILSRLIKQDQMDLTSINSDHAENIDNMRTAEEKATYCTIKCLLESQHKINENRLNKISV
jgi:hypothetical protein